MAPTLAAMQAARKAADAVFANKWHSSDPAGSVAMTIRMVITYVIIAIRLYCKFAKATSKPAIKRFGLDDLFMLLALVASTVGQGAVFWGMSRGGSGAQLPILIAGGHYQGVRKFLLGNFIGGLTDYYTLTLIRLSILAFYRTIFSVHDWFRRAIYWLAGITVIWTLACTFVHIFNCTPVDHLWNPILPGHCRNFPLFYVIVGSIETAMDAVILVLPIAPIMKLMLPLQTRLAILGIFLLGAFVIVSNILRMYFMYQPNTNYIDLQKATLWISVHITCAFACACLPLCKTFVIKFAHFGSSLSSYARSLRGNRSSAGSSRYSDKKRSDTSSNDSNSIKARDSHSKGDSRQDGTKNSYQVGVSSVPSMPDHGADGKDRIPRIIKINNEFEIV